MALAVNPSSAAGIAAGVTGVLASLQSPELLAVLAQTLVFVSPESAPAIASRIALAALNDLEPSDMVSLIASLAVTAAGVQPETFSESAAALLSVISKLPGSIQQEAALAVETVRSSMVQSIDSEIRKASLDTAAENAASNLQSAPMQTDFTSRPVEARDTPKNIPDNIIKLIAETVSKIEIGETQTTITLQKTPDLPGDVTLEVRLINGKLDVQITATDPDSAMLLQNNIAVLQGALLSASGASG
jgi:hypothetical protein